jgi:hypothetical protein
LEEIKKTRRYWQLKEEALDYIRWRTRFERDYGRAAWRATSLWMIKFA